MKFSSHINARSLANWFWLTRGKALRGGLSRVVRGVKNAERQKSASAGRSLLKVAWLVCFVPCLATCAQAQVVTVLNLTGTNVNDPSGMVVLPPGRSTFICDGAIQTLWNVTSGAGVVWGNVQTNFDQQIVVTGDGVATHYDPTKTHSDVGTCFLAGNGIGFLFCGFGWKLRMAKRVWEA